DFGSNGACEDLVIRVLVAITNGRRQLDSGALGDVAVLHQNATLVGTKQTDKELGKRRLPRSVLTDQCEKVAFPDSEADARQRWFTAWITEPDILGLQNFGGHQAGTAWKKSSSVNRASAWVRRSPSRSASRPRIATSGGLTPTSISASTFRSTVLVGPSKRIWPRSRTI